MTYNGWYAIKPNQTKLKTFLSEIARGVMIIVVETDTLTRVQILDEADCISHCTNTFGKGMNPIILPPAMGKQ